nr:hypothetical protein [Bifidobacterium sp. DSM 109957]
MLASKIGIAGSVIGAAASYIVSVVSTNIYKNVIEASGEKLQAVSGGSNNDDGNSDADAVNGNAKELGTTTADDADDKTLPLSESDDAGKSDDAGNTDETDATDNLLSTRQANARRPRSISSQPANDRIYSVSELRKHRSRNTKRTAVIVTLVSGLLAVAVTAGIVMLLTEGKGTDTVVRDLVTQTTTQPTQSDHQPAAPEHGNGSTDGTLDSTDSNGGESDSSTSNSTDSSTTNGSESSTDTSTGSTGSGTDSSTSTDGNATSGTGTGSGSTDSSTGSDSNSTTDNGSTGSTSGTTGGTTGSNSSQSTGESNSSTGTGNSSNTGAAE